MLPLTSITLSSLLTAISLAATGVACGNGGIAGDFHINHNGIMRGSAQGMSIHGIGDSRIATSEFVMSVRGQFKMLASAKLTRQGQPLAAGGRPKATQQWVSLVAHGEIQLEIPGVAGAPAVIHHARTAVYRVSEKRWILDSRELGYQGPKRISHNN